MKTAKLFLPLIIGNMLLASTGSSLYNKECKNCHGANGEALPMGKSKAIKGMPVESIEKAMQDYASGKRKAMPFVNKVKKDFIRKHSKEELHSVSQYIHKL